MGIGNQLDYRPTCKHSGCLGGGRLPDSVRGRVRSKWVCAPCATARTQTSSPDTHTPST